LPAIIKKGTGRPSRVDKGQANHRTRRSSTARKNGGRPRQGGEKRGTSGAGPWGKDDRHSRKDGFRGKEKNGGMLDAEEKKKGESNTRGQLEQKNHLLKRDGPRQGKKKEDQGKGEQGRFFLFGGKGNFLVGKKATARKKAFTYFPKQKKKKKEIKQNHKKS